jgi:protein TonB
MQLTPPLAYAQHDARKSTGRQIVSALAAVLVLHALALWLLQSQAMRVVPREAPRLMLVRLLSVVPSVPMVAPPPAPIPTPVPVPPPRPRKIPAKSKKNVTPLQHVQRDEAPAPSQAPIASAQPAPEPAAAAPPATLPETQSTQSAQAGQAMHATVSSPTTGQPKAVSHVDCNIVEPDYPEIARRRGETGTAVVRFVVDTDGRIKSVRLQRSSGYSRLDDAALDALHSSTCRPYLEAGVPVPVMFDKPFVFELEN